MQERIDSIISTIIFIVKRIWVIGGIILITADAAVQAINIFISLLLRRPISGGEWDTLLIAGLLLCILLPNPGKKKSEE